MEIKNNSTIRRLTVAFLSFATITAYVSMIFIEASMNDWAFKPGDKERFFWLTIVVYSAFFPSAGYILEYIKQRLFSSQKRIKQD